MAKSDIVGLKELERSFLELGKAPQTISTTSARSGARIALKAAKSNAPVDTGELKRGIIMKRERRRVRGKAVYDVLMSPYMNDVFVKTTKEGKRYYYPASQEYGFLTVDGGYVPGYGYLRKSVDDNRKQIEKVMLESALKTIDKAMRKK